MLFAVAGAFVVVVAAVVVEAVLLAVLLFEEDVVDVGTLAIFSQPYVSPLLIKANVLLISFWNDAFKIK